MVQNGKFEASALPFVNALKMVDFPTLGTPMMPTSSELIFEEK